MGQRAWPARVPSSVTQPHGGWRDGWSGARGPGQEAVAGLGSVGVSRRVGAATVPPVAPGASQRVAPVWLDRALGKGLSGSSAGPGGGSGSLSVLICTVGHLPPACGGPCALGVPAACYKHFPKSRSGSSAKKCSWDPKRLGGGCFQSEVHPPPGGGSGHRGLSKTKVPKPKQYQPSCGKKQTPGQRAPAPEGPHWYF